MHATCQEYNAQERTALGNPSGASPFSETPSESNGSAQNLALVQRVVSLEKRDADMKMELGSTQESFRRHDRRIESIEHTLGLRNITVADVEGYVRQQEFSSYGGRLVWKISDYACKRRVSKSLSIALVSTPVATATKCAPTFT